MPNKLQVPDHLIIDSLETLKVLSDPTRLEIMKYIGEVNKRDQRCTVKQLAKLMEVPPTKLYYHIKPTKLYYHIKLLEEKKLLIVGDTRIVSGIIEKHYQVAAMDITLSQNALSMHSGPKDLALEEILKSISQIMNNSVNNTRSSLIAIYEEERAAKEGGPPARKQVAMHVSKIEMLLTHEQAENFKVQLTALVQEFKTLSDQNARTGDEDKLYFDVMQMFVPQYQRKTSHENES